MRYFKNPLIVLIASFAITSIGCNPTKAKIDDSLKTFFDARNVDGSFALLNNIDGRVTVYNLKMDTSRFLPASTFKIVNGLIGLETGVITNDSMVIKWDGKKRTFSDGSPTPETWNKDLNFVEAFKVSSVPYFQEVARRIGQERMKQYIDTLNYGNKNIGTQIDSFWLNNTLKISPDEQLGLLKKLYFDQLPFRKTTQQSLRNAMLQEANTAYKLSYKTGWGNDETGNAIGWLEGWIEENNHVYFFVTLIQSKDPKIDMQNVRLGITTDILKKLGFMQGRK